MALDTPTPISVDTTQTPNDAPISIDYGVTQQPVPAEQAALRAAKASYGLGDQLPDSNYDYFYNEIVGGREPELRQKTAASLDLQKQMAVQKAITAVAGQERRPLSPPEVDYIKNLVQNYKPEDPNNVIEKNYSVKAISQMYTPGGPNIQDPGDDNFNWFETALQTLPKETQATIETGKQYRTNIEFARTLRENIEGEIKNQSTAGWLTDQAKNLFQLYQEYKLRGNFPTEVFGGLGTSKEAQAIGLLRLGLTDPAAYRQKLTDITNYLKGDNPTLAGEFLDAVIGQSTSQQQLDNVFTALAVPDILTGLKLIPGVAKLGRRALLEAEVRTAVKDTVKSLDNVGKQPLKAAVADAVGDLSEAAVQKATSSVQAAMQGAEPAAQKAAKDAVEALPSVMRDDVSQITKNPGRFGQEIVNRLVERYQMFESNFLDTLTSVSKVQRITPALATEAGVRAIKEEIKDRFPGLENSILNVSSIYDKGVATPSYFADLIIGKPNGELFFNKNTAKNYAEINGLHGYELKQKGVGWYVSIPMPVNETSHAVRDFLLATKASRSPDSWVNAFMGWLRTPEETLALEQRMNRKVATYAPSKLMEVAHETAKDIRDLRPKFWSSSAKKGQWQDFERTLKAAQDMPDPTRPGEKGYFFRSPGELEDFYQKTFQRLPEQQEIKAYFSFKRLGEFDHALRNIALYRNMSRVGALNHAFSVVGPDGKKLTSAFTPGVLRQALPRGEDTIMVLGEKQGQETLYRGNKIPSKERKILDNKIKDGELKVFEIYDPDLRPYQSFSPAIADQRVRYVVGKNIETKPLDYNNLPYRGGGHFEYDYSHYIKQARVRVEKVGGSLKNIYEGDTTVMPIAIRAMGQDVADKMNTVRKMIRDKDIAGAKQFVADNLPFEWKEVHQWFNPTKDPHGNLLPARLSIHEPFHVVGRNSRIIDLDKSLESRYTRVGRANAQFEDGTRGGSLARQYAVQYTGERDAQDIFTLANKGSFEKPLYEIRDPKLLDPIPTMNRAISRIANSTFMDDYKISSIEHWLREASPYLKAGDDELRYSPFHHFNSLSEDAWKPAVKKENAEKISQLKTQYQQIKQFVGTPSSTDALLHSVAQKLTDSIYAKFGPDGLKIPGTGINISPIWLIDRISDPVKFVRALTFHAKLGLFSVPQLLVQMQTFSTIAGIAGMSKAGPGAFATLLHQWANINPKMLAALDKYAGKLTLPGMSRWRPGEFMEAFNELRKTGFANVAGEYALRDDIYSAKVVKNAGQNFLDAGTYFFSRGERAVREGAWYTAYREFRDAHPTGRITDETRRQILERASLLNVNMDRSSNSILQHGLLSIPMQFLTYQIRAAELFTSKRITGVERARLLATYSALYGVPGAIGATGLPLGDNIRKAAIDHGYVVGDNWVSSVMEGIPAYILGMATGNYYNIGERFGPGGFDVVKEALRGDRSFWDIIGGAAFSTLANTWTQSDGFRTAMMSGLRGDGKFALSTPDFIDLFKEISSVNNSWRLWAAMNYGKWLSKKETETTDVSKTSAAFMFLTGLQPQQVSDLQVMQLTKKDEKELAKYSEQKFNEEFQRGVRSQDSDPKQAAQYFKRAFAWLEIGGYPEEDRSKVIANAAKNNNTLIDRMNWDYYLKNVPEDKKERRMKAYQRILQMGGH